MSDIQKPFTVGDRVLAIMHTRTDKKVGGWTTDYIPGTVLKVNRTTALVCLDEYYYAYKHTLPFRRLRKLPI